MVANDSSTGGYLLPVDAGPPYDAELDAIFQKMVVGLTALPGSLVRPRWQPTAPKQPEPGVDWCAIGVMVTTPDAGPAIIHVGAGEGSDVVQRHEEIELLCSFYGPHGSRLANMARDGMYMPQNNDILRANEMGLICVGTVTPAPDMVNQQWVRRYDVSISVRRNAQRVYPTLNLTSAEVAVRTDSGPATKASVS
ncbi:conserved protein of unknown function [Paraburkholderia dioscoreae]|uniref:Phage neck terminator protein gp12-like domain-containing protein n=1 Tax=Paraburkholderia dioscoreae TaxID=2604047 RepID=A0A5Q4YTG8_9BURK|nr:conserved protein of unknown function [Paraburkholderia dioscoreae]